MSEAHARSPEPAAVAAERAQPDGRFHAFAIRLLDIVGAGTALLVAAPLLLVVALLVKWDSPGPVLFRHTRVGQNRRRADLSYAGEDRRRTPASGQPFTLYKFRSMYADSRERFPELYAYRYSDEELHALPIKVLVGTKRNPELIEGPIDLGQSGPHDPRLTRVGAWLRRTSLDEIPNFWSVLTGSMHLVGPRPDIEENVCYYTPRQMKKLDVKPGITGLAQVRGRGALTFHETNEYDVEYVERRSLWLDLWILIQTLRVLVRGDGAF